MGSAAQTAAFHGMVKNAKPDRLQAVRLFLCRAVCGIPTHYLLNRSFPNFVKKKLTAP